MHLSRGSKKEYQDLPVRLPKIIYDKVEEVSKAHKITVTKFLQDALRMHLIYYHVWDDPQADLIIRDEKGERSIVIDKELSDEQSEGSTTIVRPN